MEVAERVQRFQRREHLAPLRYDVHYPGGDALTQKQWALALSPARVEGRFAA